MRALNIAVDPSNRKQRDAWDGSEGAHWASNARQYDRALAAYQDDFFDAAAIRDGAAVLDVGCGSGQTTRQAARLTTSGGAFGIDLSSEMLSVARRLADEEGVSNVRFEQGDAQVYPFVAEAFDVVISRTGAMFFGDPIAAFRNLRKALRPRGRIVLLAWQSIDHNEWMREFLRALAAGRDLQPPPPNAPGPFALADEARVRSLLTSAGFDEIGLQPLTRPMHFGDDATVAHRFLMGQLGWLVADLDEDARAGAVERLFSSLDAHQTRDGVLYESGAWIITAA